MGDFMGGPIQDDHLFCVLEPEGAFLYALKQRLLTALDGETKNVLGIDVGGGTLDLIIASFLNGEEPAILKSNFGSCVGGADVDKKFMADVGVIS